MFTRRNNLTISEAIDAYLASLSLAGRAPTTLRVYGYTLGVLSRHLGYNRNVRSINAAEIKEYLATVNEVSSRTYTVFVGNVIKSFFRWAEENGELKKNPASTLRMGSVKGKPVEPLSPKEVRALRQAVGSPFEEAVLLLFLDTGMRASELVNLELRDIDLQNDIVTIREGKGGRTWRVGLNEKPKEALEKYLASRPQNGRLWPEGFSYQNLVRLLDRLSARAKIKPIHAHLFRHTFCCYFLLETNDALALQQICGWTSLAMVQRYTAWVQAQRALKVHRKHSLVA